MIEKLIVNYNPGDLLLPEGWIKTTKRNVLVLGGKAELIDPKEFDEVMVLSGSNHCDQEEEKVLKETSF